MGQKIGWERGTIQNQPAWIRKDGEFAIVRLANGNTSVYQLSATRGTMRSGSGNLYAYVGDEWNVADAKSNWNG